MSPPGVEAHQHDRHPRLPTLRSVLAAFVALIGAVSILSVAAPAATADNWAPVHPGDFPDPSVLHYGNEYYGFATQNFAVPSQTINIQESISPDGVHWTPLTSDALPTLGGLGHWAKPGETWAPTVAAYSGGSQGTVFVMYYTATDSSSGTQCIGEATANTPLGPYFDANSEPVECQVGLGGSIDPDIFTDPQTGLSYLLWKNDGNADGNSTGIWSAQLAPDLQSLSQSDTQILPADPGQPWQGGVVEGPNMYYLPGPGSGGSGGTYYLFYSGGQYGTSTYAIGWATCANPSGGCQDRSGPLLPSAPGVSGPGGPDVFTLPPTTQHPDGQTVMAFAGWQGNTIGYLACGIRPMYLADVTFGPGGGAPSLSADPAGGSTAASSPTCLQPPAPPPGYWQVAADGGIFTFGSAGFYGSAGSMRLNKPVVGMAPTPDHRGYWLVASDGGIFAYGDASFYGSTGSMILNKPIVAMIPTLDGHGYWLIASDGGVFAFGDAPFYGSAGGENLAYPVAAAAPSFLGGGYWLVNANGQVYSYGNATYLGAPPFAPGGYRITGMAGTHDSSGYWLASANGNVAVFGDAAPYGSMIGTTLNSPVVGMAATHDAAGYWLQGGDGGIFTFGDAPFMGSMGGRPLNAPMVGIASV